MRQAEIYRKNILAGILTEDGGEYRFCCKRPSAERGGVFYDCVTLYA
jgi:serine/threonine-protein kinase HipA